MENSNVCPFKRNEHKKCYICNVIFGISEPRVIILKTTSRITFKNGYYVTAKIQHRIATHENCYRKKFNFKEKFLEKQSEKGYKILIPA